MTASQTKFRPVTGYPQRAFDEQRSINDHEDLPPKCDWAHASCLDLLGGMTKQPAPRRGAGAVLLLHDADTVIAAGSGGHADLGMTIIRITPAPAFEQTVRSGDLTECDATGQIAARINHAASALADV